jgi:hypothetical protein
MVHNDVVLRTADNLVEFIRRGGIVYTDSRLVAVQCCDCRRAFLLDETSGRLFLDPTDLRRVVDEDDPLECPGCRRTDWELEDLSSDELADFVRGRWGFSFWSPRAARAPRSARKKVAITIALGTLAVVGVAAFAVNPDPLAAPGQARPQIHLPASR